jgi:stearoyl-CoA desaturase (delta-9 desaturase)
LKPKIGKDATIAFNGGVQRHSKAARNLAAFMRVAVIEKAKIDKKKSASE